MADRSPTRKRSTKPSLKQRTRSHVIASLSANSIERIFLLKGHTVIKSEQDYGVDLVVFTYDSNGFVEAGNLYFQLKATDSPALSADGRFYSFSISIKDYNAWSIEPMPVFLILYDAIEGRAYWQYMQAYFGSALSSRPRKGAASVMIRLPVGNKFDESTVDYARAKKQSVLDQLTGATHHVL